MKTKFTLSLFALSALLFLPVIHSQASGGDKYASYWKCSDGNTYGLVAKGNKRTLYLPTGAAPVFFAGAKKGNTYEGDLYVGGQCIPVSGPISNNSTRVTLWSQNGSSWILNFSHK